VFAQAPTLDVDRLGAFPAFLLLLMFLLSVLGIVAQASFA
jgi:hypothetical protein